MIIILRMFRCTKNDSNHHKSFHLYDEFTEINVSHRHVTCEKERETNQKNHKDKDPQYKSFLIRLDFIMNCKILME